MSDIVGTMFITAKGVGLVAVAVARISCNGSTELNENNLSQKLHKTRNAWHSLACSPRRITVSLLANNSETLVPSSAAP